MWCPLFVIIITKYWPIFGAQFDFCLLYFTVLYCTTLFCTVLLSTCTIMQFTILHFTENENGAEIWAQKLGKISPPKIGPF